MEKVVVVVVSSSSVVPSLNLLDIAHQTKSMVDFALYTIEK
jgi:hypothetical protein